MQKSPKNWSRCHFQVLSSCDILLNNMCEAFNRAIVDTHDKPIITMSEMIRIYIRRRFVNKFELAEKWNHVVGPRVFKILGKDKDRSTECIVEYCGELKYEVRTMYNEQYRVDLGTKSCDCYKWDLIGIPCSHAIACIHKRDLNPMLFVHFWYKKATYLKAYTPIVHTMPGPEMWKKSTANPPIPPRSRTLPGRPKKLRHKGYKLKVLGLRG